MYSLKIGMNQWINESTWNEEVTSVIKEID